MVTSKFWEVRIGCGDSTVPLPSVIFRYRLPFSVGLVAFAAMLRLFRLLNKLALLILYGLGPVYT